MSIDLPDDAIAKLATNSSRSVMYAQVAHAVAVHFRSAHYLSSRLVCGAVLANLVLNEEILPHSADRIITCMRRENKSLYTTIDNGYSAVCDKFDDYARDVLANDYDDIKSLDLRNANFIVYVLSLDLKRNLEYEKSEVFYSAFTYDEIKKYGLSLFAL